jgi:hypothetical protein
MGSPGARGTSAKGRIATAVAFKASLSLVRRSGIAARAFSAIAAGRYSGGISIIGSGLFRFSRSAGLSRASATTSAGSRPVTA